jgi:hypothetical protein
MIELDPTDCVLIHNSQQLGETLRRLHKDILRARGLCDHVSLAVAIPAGRRCEVNITDLVARIGEYYDDLSIDEANSRLREVCDEFHERSEDARQECESDYARLELALAPLLMEQMRGLASVTRRLIEIISPRDQICGMMVPIILPRYLHDPMYPPYPDWNNPLIPIGVAVRAVLQDMKGVGRLSPRERAEHCRRIYRRVRQVIVATYGVSKYRQSTVARLQREADVLTERAALYRPYGGGWFSRLRRWRSNRRVDGKVCETVGKIGRDLVALHKQGRASKRHPV